jgi:hypothetical protein
MNQFKAYLVMMIFPTIAMAQDNITTTANLFFNSLTPVQQKKAQYPFNSEERQNWHFIPKNDRKGIPLEELNEPQKKAAFDLVAACLSARGAQKISDIIQLESVLQKLEGRPENDTYRDPGKYYFTLFGTPAANSIWGWRIEGHHISLNFSAQNNRLVAGTPGFMGANPAIVPDGPQKGKQTLQEETEAAFSLLHGLDAAQLSKAVISNHALSEIVTGASRKAMIENPQGIRYSDLNNNQQLLLLKLISVYIHRYTKLFADDMMKELQAAGLDKLQFAWAGSQQMQPGEGYYYRIQGPTIIIEYDNTQNNANHVHTVVRDLKHDFGGDALLEHYKEGH